MIVLGFFLSALISVQHISCTTDKLPEPMAGEECDNYDATYDGDIKDIIDSSCAISGCHVNGGGAPGVFKTYDGLLDYANDGPNGLRDRVIVLENDPNIGMPPDYSIWPVDLTDTQLEIFKCWADSGYPEN